MFARITRSLSRAAAATGAALSSAADVVTSAANQTIRALSAASDESAAAPVVSTPAASTDQVVTAAAPAQLASDPVVRPSSGLQDNYRKDIPARIVRVVDIYKGDLEISGVEGLFVALNFTFRAAIANAMKSFAKEAMHKVSLESLVRF
jgi:hypothetical protein